MLMNECPLNCYPVHGCCLCFKSLSLSYSPYEHYKGLHGLSNHVRLDFANLVTEGSRGNYHLDFPNQASINWVFDLDFEVVL